MNMPNTSPLIQEQYVKKISFALTLLQTALKNNGSIGLLDTNTVAESFFRDFLNISYDLKLKHSVVDVRRLSQQKHFL